MSEIYYFINNWRSYSENDLYYFVDEILHEILIEHNDQNLVIDLPAADRIEIRNLVDDLRLIIEDILKIKAGKKSKFPNSGSSYGRLSTETQIKIKYKQILNNFADHAFLQDGELSFNVFPRDRLNRLIRHNSIAIRFYEALMSKAVIKWLADNFYDSDLSRLNNHVNEIGTEGTDLYNRIYASGANLREFTGVKYLTDLPHKPKLYMSTRTGKKTIVFRLNELKKLVSYELTSPSHFEKGSIVTQGKYRDGAGNYHYVPLNILGETMLIINLDDINHKIYFRRDHPENFFTHNKVDKNKNFDKEIRGDKGRFLGVYYGKHGLKLVYYESAGMLTVEYLTVKPFNMLGLRAQFHMPTAIITPTSHGRTIPKSIRNAFNNPRKAEHRDLYNIIPEYHYVIQDDGTITKDPDFYRSSTGRAQIPAECTVEDWYRDVMFGGNGHIIDKIIAAGGSPPKFNPMRMESSWSPVMGSDDAKALAQAQAMCADLDINNGPFEHYKDFFKFLMNIDWAGIDGNYNEENYNQRLGLSEAQAKRLMQDHGFVWNTDPAAPLEYIGSNLANNPIEAYWNDFEHMYDPKHNPPGERRQWMEMAFLYLSQHMTSSIGSEQLHLLFPPQLVFSYWGSDDGHHLIDEESGNWLYPGDALTPLTEMSYFPDYFLSDLITTGTFSVLGKKRFIGFNIQALLNQIWLNWYPQ